VRLLKNSQEAEALEHLDTARRFNKNSAKIYIARGCALANIVSRPVRSITSRRGSGRSRKPCGWNRTTRRP
jgi:hypothetical protein